MKAVEKSEAMAKDIDTAHTVEYVNTFKTREKKDNKKLDELW